MGNESVFNPALVLGNRGLVWATPLQMMKAVVFAVALFLTAGASLAAPKVVTTIAPVQGLVADIMGAVGRPTLLLEDGKSPHLYALQPTQARALEQADIVFAIGLGLEFWLPRPAEGESRTQYVFLGENHEINVLASRRLERFGDEVESDENNPDIDSGDNPIMPEMDAFLEELLGDSTPLGEDDQQEVRRVELPAGANDPHIWLYSGNVIAMIRQIQQVLTDADPANSEIYFTNASRLIHDIENAQEAAENALARLDRVSFVVTHDSLRYLAAEYGLNVVGTVSSGNGDSAWALTLEELRKSLGARSCILIDATHPEGIAPNIFADIPQVDIDIMGTALLRQDRHYPRLLDALVEQLRNCR